MPLGLHLRRRRKSPAPSNAYTVVPSTESPEVSITKPRDLWDVAYQHLCTDEPKLLRQYEAVLLLEDQQSSSAEIGTLAPLGSCNRQDQLVALLARKIKTFENDQTLAGKFRQGTDKAAKILLITKDFVSSAVSAEPHAALAWAGVCVLLPLLLNPTSQRDSATNGFESIPFLVRRYTVIERLRRPHGSHISTQSKDTEPLVEDLENKIVQLYRLILEYQIRLIRQSSHSWPLRYGRDVIKADDWATKLNDIKTLDLECSTIARELGQEEVESGIKESNGRLDELVQSWNSGLAGLQENLMDTSAAVRAYAQGEQEWKNQEEVRKCLHVLRTKNPYEDQKNRNPSRLPGTCNWFLNSKKFHTWREDSYSSLFWVSANPGCGKSVLSKSLIEERLVTLNPNASICYFFFKDISPDSRSITKALSALLHQLFSQKPALTRHALAAYTSNGQELPNLFGTLWDILLDAAADPGAGEVICVLDAMDECEESQQINLIDAIKSFHGSSEKERTSRSQLQFLLTSRPYRNIQMRFNSLERKVSTIHLSGDDESDLISEEIDLVIRSEVSAIASERSFDSKAEAFLLERLLTMENRTYLWLHLILDQIRNSDRAGSAKELRKEIESLPQSVTQAYEAILSRTKDRKLAAKLLHILVGAERLMTIQEVNVAMSVEEDYTSYEDLELERSDVFESRMKNICGLFIYTDRSHVYLIHQTAREFLEAKVDAPEIHRETWEHSLRPEESNSVLANICVSFLMFEEFQQHSLTLNDFAESESKVAGIINRYVHDFEFLTYAAEYWITHLHCSSQYQQHVMLNKTTKLCDTSSPRVMTWYYIYQVAQDYDCDRGPWTLTDFSLAARIGSRHLIQDLVSRGADVDVKDQEGATALNRAVAGLGYEGLGYDIDIIELLLKLGADVEAGDWIVPRGEIIYGIGRPLWTAVFKSRLDVIRLLMGYGADMHRRSENADHKPASTPLELALENPLVHEEADRRDVLEALFESADVNIILDKALPISYYYISARRVTPLVLAVLTTNIAATRFFIERGADLDAQVVLEFDDNVIMDDEKRLYADSMAEKDLYRYLSGISALKVLHVAAVNEKGHAMVELLLEHGTFTRVIAGEPTLLHLAVLAQNKESINQLLEHGADMEAKDSDGQTPLAKAIEDWQVDVIPLLLEKGANPNTTDTESARTPLQLAARSGMKEVVSQLLEHGANVNAEDHNGSTALYLALGDPDITQLLLAKGANPNTTRGNAAVTLLHRAVFKGYETVVLQLLKYGASINELDRYGYTALARAVQRGYSDITQLLLERGANPNTTKATSAATPLHLAAGRGNGILVRQLLKHGASINDVDEHGHTALARAIKRGFPTTAMLLIEAFANPNTRSTGRGETPLHRCVEWGWKDVIVQLLDHGADIEMKDIYGETPLAWALEDDAQDVVELLLERGAVMPKETTLEEVLPANVTE